MKSSLSKVQSDMQREIIKFTGDTLDHITNQNGFPLPNQFFDNYKEKAEKFYKASKQSIHMTCLYCPLEYFIMYAKTSRNNPTHLKIFNGMKEEQGKEKKDLKRIRVMCVTERIMENLKEYPNLYGASFIWFLFFNTNFSSLCWCYEKTNLKEVIMSSSTLKDIDGFNEYLKFVKWLLTKIETNANNDLYLHQWIKNYYQGLADKEEKRKLTDFFADFDDEKPFLKHITKCFSDEYNQAVDKVTIKA